MHTQTHTHVQACMSRHDDVQERSKKINDEGGKTINHDVKTSHNKTFTRHHEIKDL